MVEDVNIGKTIRNILAEKGISQAKLSRILEKPATYVTRLLNKETIDTETLYGICRRLKYNLFADFSKSEMFDSEYQCMIDIKDETDDIWSPGCVLLHPHIGEKIFGILKQKKVTQSELGDFLGVSHQEISRLLKNSSIDTGKLVLISNFLEYNFFSCYYWFETSGEMMAGDTIDNILVKYVDELFIEDTVTAVLMDHDIMSKYGKNIRNMVNLINSLWKENQELKGKKKPSTSL